MSWRLSHVGLDCQILLILVCFFLPHSEVFVGNFRDESLKVTELASKLEQAFLAGLRCLQPQIRQQFVELFDNSVKKRLYDRLHYIISIQNWEMMGTHCWIKQCIEVGIKFSYTAISLTTR